MSEEMDSKKKISGQMVTIILLIGLVACLLTYMIYDKTVIAQEEERDKAYQDGLESGFNLAVMQIAQQASNGQQVPLQLGNQTINVISVETCLANIGGG